MQTCGAAAAVLPVVPVHIQYKSRVLFLSINFMGLNKCIQSVIQLSLSILIIICMGCGIT